MHQTYALSLITCPQDKQEKTFGIGEKLECDFVKYSNPGEKDQDESRLCLTTSSSAGGEKDKELGHHINSGDSSVHRLGQNQKHTHETGTGRASFQVSSDTNAERDKSRKGSPNGNTEPPGNPKDIDPGFTRENSRGYSQSSLSIASLNVKNLKTNLNFVVSLSKSHNIIILQEHWLYGFESSLAQQIYNNSNFHIKCVDDLDPIPPVQPPRGHAGTCILWENDLNHCIRVMPDGGHRVTAVEITGDRLPLCLINVYMPSRGCPDSDIQFQSTLDEVHEILEKYGHTHKILLGGDFNASLHRTQLLRRDQLLQTFLTEHNLFLPDNYPNQYTYHHEGTDARSQIDYWFLTMNGNEEVSIGDICHLNLSDHVEVTLHTSFSYEMDRSEHDQMNKMALEMQIKHKINWKKCDRQYYCDLLENGLAPLYQQIPNSQFEMDLMVTTLNKILYEASAAATPVPRAGRNRRKNKLPIWNEDIAMVVERSKQAHKLWREAGSPDSLDDPLVKGRKEARRLMRKTIRQQVYTDKQDKYQEIMEANERDTKTFYRLVNKQRTVKNTATEILYFDGKTCSTVDDVANAFSEHFERLATPSNNPDFDPAYKEQVEFDALLIELIAQQQTCAFKPVTPKEIKNIVRSFKLSKAQDIFGLSSEHLKFAPDSLYSVLSSLMECILYSGYVPPQLKQGILTPVLKKKKDAAQPTNYQGITVLSILGKILERVLQNRSNERIESKQSKMQRGFTANSSAVNADLIVSETQNEAKDLGEPLRLVTLDACKAFDVVWQESLLRKIFNVGVQGSLWVCMKNLYRGAFSAVKWQGQISEMFEIKQGVRQGGILSTLHYKLFNDDLLHLLEALKVGMVIGHIDCSCPTCADNVALLAKFLLCLQVLLTVVRYYLGRERYSINTSKSVEVVLNKIGKDTMEGNPSYGNDSLGRSDSEVHLGVDRNSTATVDFEGRVQTGRRTMYALMGAGAYGCSGVPAPLIAQLWKIYALPSMTYGLEVFSLSGKAIQSMEKMQRTILRHIQNLPPNTALTAVYGLLGVRPIEQELDLRS